MAEKEATKEAAPKAAAPKKGPTAGAPGKTKGGTPAGATDPKPAIKDGTPRMQAMYEETIRAKLTRQFGLTNPNQVPKLVKIVLNVGLGDASKNPKQLEAVVEEMAAITGQRPVITRPSRTSASGPGCRSAPR
jgi:large subunit ribosomal protein L5